VNLHSFTLILDGPLAITPWLEDAVYEAGCGDAALGQWGQVVYRMRHRPAPNPSLDISPYRNISSLHGTSPRHLRCLQRDRRAAAP
jgi:hypothetical protein